MLNKTKKKKTFKFSLQFDSIDPALDRIGIAHCVCVFFCLQIMFPYFMTIKYACSNDCTFN